METFLPCTWLYAVFNLIEYKRNPKEKPTNYNNAGMRPIDKLYADLTSNARDSTPINKLYRIHEVITDEFEYKAQDPYKPDIKLPDQTYEFTNEKILTERSRIFIYSDMLKGLDQEYFLVGLTDKRVNELKLDEFFPSLNADQYYCVSYKGQLFYLTPKSHRFGYHINELPFYYEDISTLLIPQSMSEDDYKANNIKILGVKPLSAQKLII